MFRSSMLWRAQQPVWNTLSGNLPQKNALDAIQQTYKTRVTRTLEKPRYDDIPLLRPFGVTRVRNTLFNSIMTVFITFGSTVAILWLYDHRSAFSPFTVCQTSLDDEGALAERLHCLAVLRGEEDPAAPSAKLNPK